MMMMMMMMMMIDSSSVWNTLSFWLTPFSLSLSPARFIPFQVRAPRNRKRRPSTPTSLWPNPLKWILNQRWERGGEGERGEGEGEGEGEEGFSFASCSWWCCSWKADLADIFSCWCIKHVCVIQICVCCFLRARARQQCGCASFFFGFVWECCHFLSCWTRLAWWFVNTSFFHPSSF